MLRSLQTGADPNLQDSDGESPLHKAARVGNMECVQLLLTAGGNPRLCNRWGQTCSQLALSLGQLSAATLLNSIEQGLFNPLQNSPFMTSRKRCHGDIGPQDAKRFRIADDYDSCLMDGKPAVQMLTGALDHGLLHRAEQGYNRVFIESWLSEVHGC